MGYELARDGIKTLILEKETLPRYKACGGGITLRTAKSIGFDLQPIIVDTIKTVSLTYKMKPGITRNSPAPLAYMTNRADLDYYLLKQAVESGCTLRENHKVSRLEPGSSGMAVIGQNGRFEGHIVVGADGANGIVGRSVNQPGHLRWDVCIEDEIEVSPADMERWRGRVQLDLGSIPYGYGWVFPKNDHLSVGVAGNQWAGKAVHRYHAQFSAHLEKTNPNPRLIRHTGHRLPIRRKGAPIVGDGVLLIGDAAGLTEPLSGEGIYYAVRSAQIAAKAIKDYLGNASPGLQPYEQAIDSELMPAIQRAKAYVWMFNRAPHFFFDLLTRRELLWRATCRLLGGETDYVKIGKVLGPFEPLLDWLAW